MAQPASAAGAIFLGVTPAPFRDYLAAILAGARNRCERLRFPCCGRFTLPSIALQTGWRPEQIDCSDISLFSTIIGTLARGDDPAALGVELSDSSELDFLQEYQDDPFRNGAAVLFALKYLTTPTKSYYERSFAEEMLKNAAGYLESLIQQLTTLVGHILGVGYHTADIWDEIEARPGDETTLLCANPPIRERGYTKMFETHGRLSWNSSCVEEFSAKRDYGRFWDTILEFPGLAFSYRAESLGPADSSNAVFASTQGKRIDYLLCNRPEEAKELHRLGIAQAPGPDVCSLEVPIIGPSDPITKGSRITFRRIEEKHALYYRDLWAHNLGSSSAQVYAAGFADGKLFVVAGFMSFMFAQGFTDPERRRAYAWKQFAFSPPDARPLNRLFLELMCTRDFYRWLSANMELGIWGRKGVETTCFSKHPQTMTHRGVMRLLRREKMDDGRWRLLYQQDWRDMTFTQALRSWLKREAARTKSKEVQCSPVPV